MTQLNSILSKRVSFMFNAGADYFDVHELSTSISYEDIINLWCDYEKKKFLEFLINEEDTIYDETKIDHKNIVELCKRDFRFSITLEDLFNFHYNYRHEDMLLFYIKNSDAALLKLKSYYPYIELENDLEDQIINYGTKDIDIQKNDSPELDFSSPYWSILIRDKKLIEGLSNFISDYPENTLCILGY
ncbi:hypothetical protein CPAV1605_307 [seawater metagenome]|uniref:Uncharacterized protein n=1 Tax=seawater metagenome TaxID=1561972 RepID=A0A5E8CLE7_9ZZZZ